jgi:hypothetical protein
VGDPDFSNRRMQQRSLATAGCAAFSSRWWHMIGPGGACGARVRSVVRRACWCRCCSLLSPGGSICSGSSRAHRYRQIGLASERHRLDGTLYGYRGDRLYGSAAPATRRRDGRIESPDRSERRGGPWIAQVGAGLARNVAACEGSRRSCPLSYRSCGESVPASLVGSLVSSPAAAARARRVCSE